MSVPAVMDIYANLYWECQCMSALTWLIMTKYFVAMRRDKPTGAGAWLCLYCKLIIIACYHSHFAKI